MEINNKRVKRLKGYVLGLMNKDDGQKLYEEYRQDIESVNPNEAFKIFSELIDEGNSEADILEYLGKVINVFSHGFEKIETKKISDCRFLNDLIKENQEMVKRTNLMKRILQKKNIGFNKKVEELIPIVSDLQTFESHYAKKENILFPYLENTDDRFSGLSIMWGLHDKIRSNLKQTLDLLNSPECEEIIVYKKIGEIFFDILGLKYKEENILFPAAIDILDDSLWGKMYEQSMEYDFAFIDKKKEEIIEDDSIEVLKEGSFKTETGELNFEEILLILNNLPVDLTYVDKNNKVKFFSRPKDRIFKRSPAVIGRDVNKCHPPQSVHIVEEIVEKFKSGEEDTARFWIDIKGKKLLIQYFALRNSKGEYKGVLEASQDITEIQKLEGQRRIVDWRSDK